MVKNQQIIESLAQLKLSYNEIVEYLFIISKLKQRYGEVLFSKQGYVMFDNVDKNISNVLRVLKLYKVFSILDIKSIIAYLRTQSKYKENIKIITPGKNYNKKIQLYIEEKIPESIVVNYENNDNIKVEVTGDNGRSYKRDFDRDVEKLLA